VNKENTGLFLAVAILVQLRILNYVHVCLC